MKKYDWKSIGLMLAILAAVAVVLVILSATFGTGLQLLLLLIFLVFAIGIYICRDLHKVQRDEPSLLKLGPEK